jgi:intein/homing endonuclease
MPRKMRVVTSGDENRPKMNRTARIPPQIVQADNGKFVVPRYTDKEIAVRKASRNPAYFTTSSFGLRTSADVMDSNTSQFYSPQLSTDFLEKPQNVRERRAFCRFMYNTNEIVGRAIDIHSTLPLSKLRLVAPKGSNQDQNEYVMKFFENMCDEMKLFKTLIEITHEYFLFGSCCKKDAEIRVIDGYKKAEDIRVGDYVLTNKGRYRKVLKMMRRPSEEILDIGCYKYYKKLSITEEHPVEILRGDEFVFEKAGNLNINDYIRLTYPTEIADVDSVNLTFSDSYKKVEGGYNLTFKMIEPRNKFGYEARVKFLNWAHNLKEPTIISRRQIAEDLGVNYSTLNNILYYLGKELDFKFHERIGAKGFQQGSQVIWYPIKENIETTKEYTIIKNIFLPSIDTLNIDNDFCYLAGYWLGDGTLTRDDRGTWGRGNWRIFSVDDENINRIRSILHKIFGKDSISEGEDEKGVHYLSVISNPAFIEWWAENFGETSFGENFKRVPEWFLKLPKEKLLNFIPGLIDSDGCVSTSGLKSKCVVVVAMTSKHIVDALRDACLKCDLIFSYQKRNSGYIRSHYPDLSNFYGEIEDVEYRDFYIISTMDEDSCRTMTKYGIKQIPEGREFSIANEDMIRVGDDVALKVRSIEQKEYNDFVYNFEVEDDHTFQVNGFSTHNCSIFCQDNDLDDLTEDERAVEKEKASQRSEFLKQQYKVVDKDPTYKGWEKLIIIPLDQVRIRKLPLSDDIAVEYVPDSQTKEFITGGGYFAQDGSADKKKSSIPKMLQDQVRQSGVINLDTDPYSGSHFFLLSRKKCQYEPVGNSIIERCTNTLTLLDKLRQAQTSIASRHMTPMRIVWCEGQTYEDVDNLREQVDMALVDPDYSIISNREIHWEEMGSQGRLLDIEAENEAGLTRLLAGLGMTREILTGEGSYTGSRIGLEIINTEYLLFREILQDFVENSLFKPVAKRKGFVDVDKYGNETLLYPKLSFTRLAIRDNDQYFDAVFQLYQKGSVSIDLLLDILNIDPISTKQKIEEDMFTVNDSMFNELLRNVYTNISAPIVDETDLKEKLARYMHLNPKPTEEEGNKRFSSVKVEPVAKPEPVKDSEPEVKVASEDRVQLMKLARLMRYFKDNPEQLEKAVKHVTENK